MKIGRLMIGRELFGRMKLKSIVLTPMVASGAGLGPVKQFKINIVSLQLSTVAAILSFGVQFHMQGLAGYVKLMAIWIKYYIRKYYKMTWRKQSNMPVKS
jgi:hypothetical protein